MQDLGLQVSAGRALGEGNDGTGGQGGEGRGRRAGARAGAQRARAGGPSSVACV